MIFFVAGLVCGFGVAVLIPQRRRRISDRVARFMEDAVEFWTGEVEIQNQLETEACVWLAGTDPGRALIARIVRDALPKGFKSAEQMAYDNGRLSVATEVILAGNAARHQEAEKQ